MNTQLPVDNKIIQREQIPELKQIANYVFGSIDISSTSRKDYSYRIESFIKFISSQGLHRNSLLDYKRELEKRIDLKVSTKNKFFVVGKIFLRELSRLGKIPIDYTANVKGFKDLKKHKKFGLTEEEIRRITGKLNDLPATKKTYRLKALLALLIFQGLRQIEILRLTIEDIDLRQGVIQIQGKGYQDKENIFIHPATAKAIGKYIEFANIKNGFLFTSFSNRKGTGQLSHTSLFREVKSLFRELDIDRTIHGFRHHYCTALLEQLGDVNTVRKFTRHRSVDTLIIYDDLLDLRNKKDKVFSCFENIAMN
ncbi:MAG: tyrosine-type recombinase/integrase [Ignavibacteria bacterium]|jgi:integrase|nr:tyrosine-type recombinase/integrase [Ignavibacteria bacterium]MCU7518617.1 tyrosine-type recombinase/integrase [Ignavibacteria bacterium]